MAARFRLSESCRQIHIIKFSSAYLQLLPGFMPANCRIGGSFSCYRRILAKFICFISKIAYIRFALAQDKTAFAQSKTALAQETKIPQNKNLCANIVL